MPRIAHAMDNDRWEQLKENIKRKFKVLDEGFEDLIMDTADGPVKQGQTEFLVVETPMGQIKLARESKPRVLDKKFIYSHQQGKSARTEYKFSDTEFTHKIKAYQWDDVSEQWKEIDADSLAS
jgi:hypothetical protein